MSKPIRYAVLADIHGNLPALEAVLADACQHGAGEYLIAGDLLSRAPFPLQVMDRLRSLDACFIRGNAEQYQIDYARSGSPFNSLMHGIIFWTHQVIGDRGVAWMESLPETAAPALPGLPPMRMVHASPGSLSRGLAPDDPPVQAVFQRAGLGDTPRSPLSSVLEMIPESVFICGHTHIPWQERHGEKLAFNPGAVGMPINDDPRAQYALLE